MLSFSGNERSEELLDLLLNTNLGVLFDFHLSFLIDLQVTIM